MALNAILLSYMRVSMKTMEANSFGDYCITETNRPTLHFTAIADSLTG